jgi:hypothetical protein
VTFSRRDTLKTVGAVGAGGAGFAATTVAQDGDDESLQAAQPRRDPPRAYEDYAVHRVGEDAEYDTIQRAVEEAESKHLVLVEPGVYNEAVKVLDTPQLTIRGTDRNDVVLDGEFELQDGILATVDGVVVENMTARNYQRNGFFWSSVTGWRGSYLTAHNNKVYGIYNIDSSHGRYDHCYASGHGDGGFYVGQCKPCHARLENVRAERNGLGYSGTNAGGRLTIADSEFRYNMGGIVPNSLDSEEDPPQEASRIENNVVEANNNAWAPTVGYTYASLGVGINIAGGHDNEVVDNEVRDHVNFGVLAGIMQDENLYRPEGNRFEGNVIENSGRADLAEAAPSGGGNEFVDNEYDTARPAGLDDGTGLTDGGDPWVSMVLFKQFQQLEAEENPSGDWKEIQDPPFDELESMPNAEAEPPKEAVRR